MGEKDCGCSDDCQCRTEVGPQLSFSSAQLDLILLALAPLVGAEIGALVEELAQGRPESSALESFAAVLETTINDTRFLQILLKEFTEMQKVLRARFDRIMASGITRVYPMVGPSLAFNIVARAAFIEALKERIEGLAESDEG